MDNQKYWEKRKAQRMVQAMDQAEQTAKQLDEIHKLASRHITSKIDQIFESYRRDHGLTEDEAKRVLANVKDLSDIRELKLALQNTTDSEEIRQLLILLDSAPYASRIERYEALQREVDNLPTRLYKAENEASRAFYDEFIPDAYYHSIFDLQQQSGVAFAFNRIDPEEIRAIQQTPWLGANYSERIWGNTQALANELQKQLAVSLLTGRSAHETAEVINAQFGKGSYNSRRLVRTEASHFHAEMEALAYEEAEVERYRLVAVLDLRTSSVCREHDGEVYLVSERVKGKNYPPLHPWCRTVTIALDDEEWLAKATRSARDPVTGKTIQVPANMTYKDWYEKYVDKAADLVENSAQKLYNQDMENHIEIDKFTPCLEEVKTGKIIKTNYLKSQLITKSESMELQKQGWLFDWSIPQMNGYDVYKLYRQNSKRIEGMIALKVDHSNSAVHIDIVENSPKNRGGDKEYYGVGGHLFAIATKVSYTEGFEGFTYFTAKTDLVKHYQKELGAKVIAGRVMAIDEQAAYNLLSKYELIEEDKND
ncbi:minor capsid protein [Streptococcus suis]|uniref:minor capsid protein n=1 Tax=Streptococcus suis TaxID=1307 RepID=UPI002117315F|nr:minor capsid protein [Streptococcus suis]MCQ8264054.1 minor capsid protein [Streptococcus suis]